MRIVMSKKRLGTRVFIPHPSSLLQKRLDSKDKRPADAGAIPQAGGDDVLVYVLDYFGNLKVAIEAALGVPAYGREQSRQMHHAAAQNDAFWRQGEDDVDE